MTDLIILDTNIYIDIFRSGISASKTITDFLATNKMNIWVPRQVVEEYEVNYKEDFNKVPYDKINKKMEKTLDKYKEKMITELLTHERRGSDNFTK